MRKIVLFMHTSLDGFTAGPNGEMDWIIVNEEMFDIAKEQTEQADTALYGRVTYQMMDAYWPTAGDKPGASKHDIATFSNTQADTSKQLTNGCVKPQSRCPIVRHSNCV